jgi:peptide/nickel transport system substrate-binding protein
VAAVPMAFTLAVLGSAFGGSQPSGAASSGGTLVIGSAVAPPSLDPTSNASAAIDEVFDYNVYQHLVQLDPKGAVIPALATNYKVSADGLKYTFTIRSGVSFSNGDPMTAADVVFSLNRAVNPKSVYPYQVLVAGVSSVTSPDASTVVVTLSKPDNQFLYNLAAYSNGMVLDPAAVANIATNPVGTGPYMYTSQISNYDVVLAANPNYWGPKPGMSTVTFRYFASASTMDSALQSGQIQVIDNLDNSQNVSLFKHNSSFKVINGPTEGKIDLTLNNTAGPLKKLKVRQAITYATDKKAILKTVGAGYGTVIGSDQIPGDPWYTPSVNNAYSYNPQKARKLLAQAGYKHGFSITLTLPPYGYATTAGPLIQAELAAVGIKVTIKNIAWALWISKVFTDHNYQLTIIDQVEARDIGEYGTCSYYFNYGGCKQVTKMMSIATAATTTKKEVAQFRAIVRKISADAANNWLYNPDQLTVAAKDIVGLPGGALTESFNLSYVSVGGSLSSQVVAEGFAF